MKKILSQLIILIVCFGLVTPVFASDTAILDVDLITDITSQEPTQDTPELPPEEPQPQEEQQPQEPEPSQTSEIVSPTSASTPPEEDIGTEQESVDIEEETLASPSGGPSGGSIEEDITDTSAYELLDFNNHNPGLTSFISDAVSDLFNNLKKLGVTIKDGVIKAIKLVVDEVKTRILRIKVVKDRDNVIGAAVFPPLANEAVIVNSLVEKGCKIFISFRSDTGNRTWHISKKIPGYGFKIRLSEITPKPLEFDYWIVLIEGQEPADTGYQQALTPEPELPTEVGTPTESVGAEIADCIDPEATNYNPEATIDDGSCEYATQRFYWNN